MAFDARSAVNRAESTPRPRLKRERLTCDQRHESIGTSGDWVFRDPFGDPNHQQSGIF